MTQKEKILKYLDDPKIALSCQEICSRIIQEEKLTGNVARYLNGSISSKLKKLVDQKVLKLCCLEDS